MQDKIYNLSPNFLQNFLIYLYNKKAYKRRYGGKYWEYRKEKEANRSLTLVELKKYQSKRYKEFIKFVLLNSEYYNNSLGSIKNISDLKNIENLPIINKEIIRKNISSIVVKTDEKLGRSKTGGTTGKSLEVQNFARNSQERFAFLDDFRSRFGYELGKKTAWFSGKNLLTKRDLNKNRFWKTDCIHKVRYYSTFHVKDEYLNYYIDNLLSYKPEYLVGFPSTMNEIAKYGIRHDLQFPKGIVKAIFPTAETITPLIRENIEHFFNCKLYDQYASSEGAPFIFECKKGNLHIELQSGVFEVLDESNRPVQSGRLVVTSFTNEGTPLIRYDIGDNITLDNDVETCTCGNNNPLVKQIMGRTDDYIYSPDNGKINLGNVSNTLKKTKGIIKFQAIQDSLDEVSLLLIVDNSEYSKEIEKVFLKNWEERVGNKMLITIKYVESIPVEKSGKFRIVKNNIKHLIL